MNKLPETVRLSLGALRDGLSKYFGTTFRLNAKTVNLKQIEETIYHYNMVIEEIAGWPNIHFLILTDLNGVLGYRSYQKGKSQNRSFRLRPNLKVFLSELDKTLSIDTDPTGIRALVYTSARYGNIKALLDGIDRGKYSKLEDLSDIVIDQLFCFIRELKLENFDPIDDDDIDGEGIKEFLNDYLLDLHVMMQEAICDEDPESVVDAIYLISIILQLFMRKASKDLENLENFVRACRYPGHGSVESYEEPLTLVLLDDETDKKLPLDQLENGYQIMSYNEDTAGFFDYQEDSNNIRKEFRKIRKRISDANTSENQGGGGHFYPGGREVLQKSIDGMRKRREKKAQKESQK